MQLIFSLLVVLFLSIGAFFVYVKENQNQNYNKTPKILKQVNINFYSTDSAKNVWVVKGSVLKISGRYIYLKNIVAQNSSYIITAKEGKLAKDTGIGYLEKDVSILKAEDDHIYTQYTNIDLKKSHFWGDDDIIFYTKHFSGEGKSFDIHLKPNLNVIIYNIKSYER